MSVLAQRVATAVVMLAIVLASVLLLPSRGFALALLVVVLLAAREWAKLIGLSAGAGWLFVAAVLVIACVLLLAPGAAFAQGWPHVLLAVVCGAATLFWLLVAPCWVIARWPTRSRVAMVLVGALVLTGLWMALVELHARSPWLLLAAMALVWIADTAAYFAGRKFGRHKLAPQVSPGKTWEGVAGAFVGVAVYAIACAFFIASRGDGGVESPSTATVAGWIVVALVLAAMSIVGDLYESWLKRGAGVKDSGALLPGHGGILDRIDALLAAMPPAALAMQAWLR